VIRLVALTTLLLVVADGCGGNGKTATSKLEDTPWVLVSGRNIDVPNGVWPSAVFREGRAAGSTGCNRFGAPYTLDGDKIELGEAFATKMSCGPQLDDLERSYFSALHKVERWHVDDDVLSLSDADGNELLRYHVAIPVGEWHATGLLQGDAFTSLAAGTEISATFGKDGTLAGSGGCNRYHSHYTVDRATLTIDPPAATRKSCGAPEGVMEQEQAYLSLLDSVAGFDLAGRTLELSSADGTALVQFAR
jgi:heat shock protein HslJ